MDQAPALGRDLRAAVTKTLQHWVQSVLELWRKEPRKQQELPGNQAAVRQEDPLRGPRTAVAQQGQAGVVSEGHRAGILSDLRDNVNWVKCRGPQGLGTPAGGAARASLGSLQDPREEACQKHHGRKPLQRGRRTPAHRRDEGAPVASSSSPRTTSPLNSAGAAQKHLDGSRRGRGPSPRNVPPPAWSKTPGLTFLGTCPVWGTHPPQGISRQPRPGVTWWAEREVCATLQQEEAVPLVLEKPEWRGQGRARRAQPLVTGETPGTAESFPPKQ